LRRGARAIHLRDPASDRPHPLPEPRTSYPLAAAAVIGGEIASIFPPATHLTKSLERGNSLPFFPRGSSLPPRRSTGIRPVHGQDGHGTPARPRRASGASFRTRAATLTWVLLPARRL